MSSVRSPLPRCRLPTGGPGPIRAGHVLRAGTSCSPPSGQGLSRSDGLLGAGAGASLRRRGIRRGSLRQSRTGCSRAAADVPDVVTSRTCSTKRTPLPSGGGRTRCSGRSRNDVAGWTHWSLRSVQLEDGLVEAAERLPATARYTATRTGRRCGKASGSRNGPGPWAAVLVLKLTLTTPRVA
jgi:hypothetical protein